MSSQSAAISDTAWGEPLSLLGLQDQLHRKRLRRITGRIVTRLVTKRANQRMRSSYNGHRDLHREHAGINVQLLPGLEAEAVLRPRRILHRLRLHAIGSIQLQSGRNQQLRLRSMRVHVITIHHAEAHLHHAPLPCLHRLLLSLITHILLRLRERSTQVARLLSNQHTGDRKQPGKRNRPHSPPAETVLLPEAIAFLMFASISSFVPSPAVSSTTT